MNEIILASSSKDSSGGISILDLSTFSPISSQFRECIADKNCMVMIGKSSSSYSGDGSCGDYIFSSQCNKPLINSWHWTKPQVHDRYHIQEIITALATDSSGTFLVGGSKRGYLFVWDIISGELLRTFQCHYKAVTCILFDKTDSLMVTSSEDGIIRVWEWYQFIEAQIGNTSTRRSDNISPYRSWSTHTLAVKDMAMIGNMSVKRVASCSLDRSVVIHDIYSNSIVLKISLPHSLESICVSHMEDYLIAGSSSGHIFAIDLSVNAIAMSAAKSMIISSTSSLPYKPANETKSMTVLEGHSKAVTSLVMSADDLSLVSSSLDGSIRIWNIWTRQCVKELKPFPGGAPVTNLLLIAKPDILSHNIQNPTLHPLHRLSKYKDENKATASSTVLSDAYFGRNGNIEISRTCLEDVDFAFRGSSHSAIVPSSNDGEYAMGDNIIFSTEQSVSEDVTVVIDTKKRYMIGDQAKSSVDTSSAKRSREEVEADSTSNDLSMKSKAFSLVAENLSHSKQSKKDKKMKPLRSSSG
jgi:pre-rRNA-processing protein IPI3